MTADNHLCLHTDICVPAPPMLDSTFLLKRTQKFCWIGCLGFLLRLFFLLKGVSGGGIMNLPTNQVLVLLGWLDRASQPDSEKHILSSPVESFLHVHRKIGA